MLTEVSWASPMVTNRECMIWIQTLCPGSVRVSCSAGEQQGALLPLTPEISTAQYHTGWTADTACWSPVTPAALHFLECFGKRLRHWCPASLGGNSWGNEFSVEGSRRAGVSEDESHPSCKTLPKGFENDPVHRDRETIWTQTRRISGETPTCTSTFTAREVSQHPARAGTWLQRAGNPGC